jgi:hypothetical protein
MSALLLKAEIAERALGCPLSARNRHRAVSLLLLKTYIVRRQGLRQLSLVDDFIGDSQQVWRDSKAKRFRRLEIEG